MMSSCKGSINVNYHGICLDDKKKRVQCNYCNKVVSGFHRLKCHLGGLGTDVISCEQVPQNVKEAFRNMLQENKNKALVKEVEKLCHPYLPLKRNWSLTSDSVNYIKHEAGQTAGCGIRKQEEIDSEVEDDATDLFPIHNRSLASKVAINIKAKEDVSSKQTKKCIGKFFYETGIDLRNASSPSFKRMLNAMPGNDGVKIPTLQELKGWILQDEVKETIEYVKKIGDSWASTGCSILLDGWVTEKGQNLVSFIVECPKGPIYLYSADVSSMTNDAGALKLLLDEVIEEVGIENVVQVVACSTTGWVGNIGTQFVDRHRTVFWSVSASHCIKLMLEKIVTIDCIKGILDKAKIFTKFIYEHGELLELMRKYIHCHDLMKPFKMKFAVPFLTLENIVSEKKNLRKMLISFDWKNSGWSSTPEGMRMAHLMGDVSFWNGAEMTLKATVPLIRVLHLIIEADEPQLGNIYEIMDQAKETIKEEFRNKRSQYLPFWKAIDEIWDNYLYSPLHAAGYYLNPSLFYSTDFYCDHEVSYGLLCSIVRMVQDHHTQDLISHQLDEYRHARGDFKEGSAIDRRTSLPPAQWWYTYGKQHPELQKFAIRILSQTCDGAAKYGLKRSLAEKLRMNGRNRSEQDGLSDLAFVHYNLHLQNTQIGDGSDSMDDWIEDNATLETLPSNGGSLCVEADFSEATANMEEFYLQAKRKIKNSKAVIQKQKKKAQ